MGEQNKSISQQLEEKVSALKNLVKSEEAKAVMQEDATPVEKDTEVAMDTETDEVEEEKFKEKISDNDKETITNKCEETMKGLEANQLAEVDEFLDQKKAVEGVCNPIISKLEQADSVGELPGDMPGETPGSNESAGD